MSGHLQSEVNNEHCTTPDKMTVLGGKDFEHYVIKTEVKKELELSLCTEEMETQLSRGKDIEHNMIKTEVKEEQDLSPCSEEIETRLFTWVECVKCEELEYKKDMPKAVLKDKLDFESLGLLDDRDIKYEVLEEAIDSEEQKLFCKEDGQDEKSELMQYLKPMEPEGSVSGKECKKTQPKNIKDGSTLAPGGKSIPEKQFGSSFMCLVRYRTDTEGSSSKIMSQNTHTNVDVDNRDSTHSEMYVSKDGGDKYLKIRHMRMHSDEKPYECEICKTRFKKRFPLKSHLRSHSDEKPFECEICKSRFKHKSNLKSHLKTHSGEKPFQCDICQGRFTKKHSLKSHLTTHTGEKPFKCELCPLRFNYKSGLTIHLRYHTDEKPFECEICKARFNHKGNFKSHLRIHSDEKPFECELCHVRFNYKSSLTIHLRTHTDEKPFQCEICKMRFKRKGNLNLHLRTTCTICKVTFKSQCIIKGVKKPFQCDKCKLRFIPESNLKTYSAIHRKKKQA